MERSVGIPNADLGGIQEWEICTVLGGEEKKQQDLIEVLLSNLVGREFPS